VRPESGRKLAESLPNGRWLPLYGVGHFPMLEHPRFGAHVADFLHGATLGERPMPKSWAIWQWLKDRMTFHG
jgi:hypothetical protein